MKNRLRTGLIAVVAAVTAVIPTAVHAAFLDAAVACRTGTTGDACVRFRWDPDYPRAYTYGATDPNPGYTMGLDHVSLHGIGSTGIDYTLRNQGPGTVSGSHQSLSTYYYYPDGYCYSYYSHLTYWTPANGVYYKVETSPQFRC